MTRIAFAIAGRPIGKARPRVTRRGAFMPAQYVAWCACIREEALVACAELEDRGEPWDATAPAYRVRVVATFAGAIHGDVDNLGGSVLDALNGLLWADDKLVTDLRVSKAMGADGLRVEVEALAASPMAAAKSRSRPRACFGDEERMPFPVPKRAAKGRKR